MLELLKVELEDFKKYIDIGFRDDAELELYYDKSVEVSGMDEMINNTYEKIKDFYNYFSECKCYKVDLDNKDIGFLFLNNNPNVLISFSISKEHRNSKILKQFFDLIVLELENSFTCLLFNENDRGINWLKKCGMKVDIITEAYTKLNY